MATTTPLTKKSQVWEKSRVWECLATGEEERFSWVTSSSFQTHFISKCVGGAKCINLDAHGNPVITGRIDVDEDPVCSITSTIPRESLDHLIVFTAHKSGLVRKWSGNNLEEPSQGQIAFKADHKGPILHLKVLNNGGKNNELVTIGSDYMIKLWNIETHHCLSVLRGITSVPLCTEKYENILEETCYLASGLVDGNIKLWSMKRDDDSSCWMVPASNVVATTLVKHHSQVTRDNWFQYPIFSPKIMARPQHFYG